MTEVRTTQLALISVGQPDPCPTRVTQAAIISVQSPPNIPIHTTQMAAIIVASNNRAYLQLDNPIGLDCWQPCTAYATPSLIVRLDGGVNGNG